MKLHEKCSHDISFDAECVQCDGIGEQETLKLVSDLCHRSASFYERNPGLVQPETVVDLYRTIGRIIAIIEKNPTAASGKEG